MSLSSTKEILSGKIAIGEKVTVAGWIRTRRDSKAGFSFLAVNDGSGFDNVQIIAPNTLNNYESEILKLTTGCSVVVDGTLKASEGKGQAYEINADKVFVTGFVEDPDTYPMSAKRHSVEYLREYAHLRPRTNLMGAVMRIRNTVAYAIHSFFQENGFMWVATPLITSSDCEGAGEMFTVTNFDLNNVPKNDKGEADFSKDFFGKHAYMTVSGQLNVETYACAFSKVYTFGPTFRAENSNTTRHLAEFWMVEPEMAFTDLDGCATTAEKLLKYVFKTVLEQRADDMKFIAERVDKDAITRLEHFISSDFAKVDYTDAIEILKKATKKFEYPVEWGIDLQSEHERYLAEEHFKAPVVVKNYPRDIKAFYMKQNDDGKTVAAMDVLAPGIGEIIGGSQREYKLEKIDKRIDELGMNKYRYWCYLDL
uniref:asparagine--tRNA ligase n=1 Tax=Succinivibrio sp. TaxID=2053619 RepID=UPI00402A889B